MSYGAVGKGKAAHGFFCFLLNPRMGQEPPLALIHLILNLDTERILVMELKRISPNELSELVRALDEGTCEEQIQALKELCPCRSRVYDPEVWLKIFRKRWGFLCCVILAFFV